MRYHRICKECNKEFDTSNYQQKFCCINCKRKNLSHRAMVSKNTSTGSAGKAVEMIISSKLILDGWSVFTAVTPCSSVDIIAFMGDKIRMIECRTGVRSDSGRLIYSDVINKGFPRPTEIAVYEHSTGSVSFFPISII